MKTIKITIQGVAVNAISKGSNFDVRISREEAIGLIEMGITLPFEIMSKEYGDDEDWNGVYSDDLESILSDDDYQTFEIWCNNIEDDINLLAIYSDCLVEPSSAKDVLAWLWDFNKRWEYMDGRKDFSTFEGFLIAEIETLCDVQGLVHESADEMWTHLMELSSEHNTERSFFMTDEENNTGIFEVLEDMSISDARQLALNNNLTDGNMLGSEFSEAYYFYKGVYFTSKGGDYYLDYSNQGYGTKSLKEMKTFITKNLNNILG